MLLKLIQKMAREEHFQTHSTRPASPDIKTKDSTKKVKLQANITNEYRCKNPQQNINKLEFNNSLILSQSGIYPKDAKMVQ